MLTWETVRAFIEAAVSVFALTNPVGGRPMLVGLTEDVETDDRRKLFRLAGVTALIVICVMALAGQVLLEYVFHITIHEFMFGGGLLLVLIGIMNILTDPHSRRIALDQDPEARKRQQVRLAVTPIAVPLLVGPGSIVNVMLLANLHGRIFAVTACVVAFVFVILILNYAHLIYRLMGRIGALAAGRVMEIFIVAIGVKFCFQAIKAVFPGLMH